MKIVAPHPPSPSQVPNQTQVKQQSPILKMKQYANSTPALRNSSPVLPHYTLPMSMLDHLHFPAPSSVSHGQKEPITIEDALNSLSTSLEDFHGQYRELEKLEDIVVLLEQILRVSF